VSTEPQTTYETQTAHDDDPVLLMLAFVAAAGFGSGAPILGLVGLALCAGHISAKVDPDGAPARLLTSGQRGAAALIRGDTTAPAVVDDQAQAQAGDIFELLTSGRHALIVGHTGGGKSTLLHNLAAAHAQAGADVLVIDVDSIAGKYPGYRVVGCGDDYDGASAGLAIVRRGLEQRRQARRDGQRQFKRIVVLIDEAQDVVREIDGAWPILEDVIRRGRKLNIFAVIAAQDSQVKNLKLEGKSHLLGNLTRCDVRRQAGQRVAVVGNDVYPLPRLRAPDELVRASGTKPPKPVSKPVSPGAGFSDETTLLNQLLEGSFDQFQAVNRPGNNDARETTLNRSDIAAAYSRLGSKNKVWEWLRDTHGVGNKVTAYRLIDQALDAQADDDDEQHRLTLLA
jgi:energy-coupling factor transporter ATP-binding protein EcfA2